MRKWLVILAFILGACKQPKQSEEPLTFKKLASDTIATNLSFTIGDPGGEILSSGESESLAIPWREGQPIKNYKVLQISAASDGEPQFAVSKTSHDTFEYYGVYACGNRCTFVAGGEAQSKDTFAIQVVKANGARVISVSVVLREEK